MRTPLQQSRKGWPWSSFTTYFSQCSIGEHETCSHEHLRNLEQIGLIASTTVFVTGRPNTLFQDDQVFSSGTVGIVLNQTRFSHFKLNYSALRPISQQLRVAQYGILIVSTRLLICSAHTAILYTRWVPQRRLALCFNLYTMPVSAITLLSRTTFSLQSARVGARSPPKNTRHSYR